LDDKQAAIADYNKAIELNPKFALAFNNRGLVYYDFGNIKAANSDWRKAIEPILLMAYNRRK
jgi:tetratricopeptide (TPR) repeat protein